MRGLSLLIHDWIAIFSVADAADTAGDVVLRLMQEAAME
jgi:hypothetical protein